MSIKAAIEDKIETYQKEYNKAIDTGDTHYASLLKDRIDRFKKQLDRL